VLHIASRIHAMQCQHRIVYFRDVKKVTKHNLYDMFYKKKLFTR